MSEESVVNLKETLLGCQGLEAPQGNVGRRYQRPVCRDETHPISSIYGRRCTPCFRLFVLQSVDRSIRACSSFAMHESTVDGTDGLGDEHLS